MSNAIPSTGVFEHSHGTIVANGTEQTIFEEAHTGAYEGYLDLEKMVDGDEVTLCEYIDLLGSSGYKKYQNEDYSGPQEFPIIYIIPKPGGPLKITLQQTQGSYKQFDFKFYQRR